MSYHSKALFREEMNIKGFIKDFGIGRGNTFFFTMTFKHNITDKKEAVRCWNILRTQLTKIHPILRYICVWERQNRGAWHLHALCNCPSLGALVHFKDLVKDLVKKSNTSMGFTAARWTYGTYKSIGNYMYKYLTKEHREKFIRYINYSRNFLRKCSSIFMFVGGPAGAWRACCRVLDDMFPETFKFFYKNASFAYLLPCVNGVNGDLKSFFYGLQNMLVYFEKIKTLSVRCEYSIRFKIQLNSFKQDCVRCYEKIYPYGQLTLNLR